MKKEQKNNLLSKYYKGETSLKEEEYLKQEFLSDEQLSPEKDAFEFYAEEGRMPEGLEEDIFDAISNRQHKKKTLIRRLVPISSAAAAVLIILSVYLGAREKKIREMESKFMVMEQAMYQVSETIQPREQEDMLVLRVDDNVEIIIN